MEIPNWLILLWEYGKFYNWGLWVLLFYNYIRIYLVCWLKIKIWFLILLMALIRISTTHIFWLYIAFFYIQFRLIIFRLCRKKFNLADKRTNKRTLIIIRCGNRFYFGLHQITSYNTTQKLKSKSYKKMTIQRIDSILAYLLKGKLMPFIYRSAHSISSPVTWDISMVSRFPNKSVTNFARIKSYIGMRKTKIFQLEKLFCL